MQTKYDLVNKMFRGRLPYELNRRRERGDSYQSISFWLQATHGIEISYETARQWCQLALDDPEPVEATG